MKQMKRVLSFIMAVLMMVQLLPMNVLAEMTGDDSETHASDSLKSSTWSVDFRFDGAVVETLLVQNGESIGDSLPDLPDNPDPDGQPYTGWYADGLEITAETPITRNLTAEPSYAPLTRAAAGESVVIRYTAGEGGSVSSESEEIDLSDETAAVQGSTAVPNEGYVFVNWTDGNGVVSDSETFVPEIPEEPEAEYSYTANFAELITVTFDPTTDPDEQLEPETIQIVQGTAIGDNLPTVPEISGYHTKWVFEGTETSVTGETVVNEPFTAVVFKGDKIVHTVTFVQENGTEEIRTTDIDAGYAINELPEVTPKTNRIGKWVYPGTSNEFTVGTVVLEDITVNAYYEQNIFSVTFMVDNALYEEMTTATGTTIILPSDPIKDGATFVGWFTQPGGEGTQYTSSSTVNQDLMLYAYFSDQVRVAFLVKDENGNVISEKSQYFVDVTVGEQITVLPDDPFIPGKVFEHWEHETDHTAVEVGTTVTESFNAVAVFKTIDSYALTVNYFYRNEGNVRIDVGSQIYELVEDDFPYTVTAPGYTIATEVTDEPTYYPSRPTITVDKSDFTLDEESGKYIHTEEDEYVAADAQYKVGHYLKELTGDNYSLIETVNKIGVKNSKVTPDINSYAYAQYARRDEDITLTGEASQELKVYYTRRDFTLSYNVGGGDYIDAVNAKYGSTITLPTTATRSGYIFAGWYKDEDCTQSVGTSIVLENNTTLYAKWNPSEVNYQIVYMIENANDNDYSYLATVTKRANTDSSITMNATSAGANGTRPGDLDTTNFTFKDSTTETVKADGTTVVVVRYSRNVYTLQGRNGNSGLNVSLQAKYGADITTQWNSTFGAQDTGNTSYSWSYNNENDSKFKSLNVMPSLSVRTNRSPDNTIYLYRHNDTKDYYQQQNYWLQNYESSTTTTWNGKTYGLVRQVNTRYGFLSDVDDWYDIPGYTKAGYTATSSETKNGTYNSFTYSWGTQFSSYNYVSWGRWHYYATYTRFNFYYDAQEYPLTFYNYNGTLISTQQVTLGNDISSYLTSNVPDAPMDGATWKGWYTDSEHTPGNEYSGGIKMPAGLILYGDFEFPTHTVTFDSKGGSKVDSQTDEYGFYAVMPDSPTRDHYHFQGWFTAADEAGTPYDWNQPVLADITLYAHWSQETISYTVHYYEQGTTTKVLDDKVVSDPDFTEGDEITEIAPSVAGHVSDNASVTISLSFDEEANTIIFYYHTIPDEITYTVNYVIQGTDIKVAESKTVTVSGSTTNVLELAKEVDPAYLATQTSDADILRKHYKPVVSSIEKQLALENNVIKFEYITYTTSKITVNYLDMDGNSIHAADTSYVEKGDTFTLLNKATDGYVYHHAYLDGTTTAPQPTYQITGNEGDLVINVYYQKKLIIIANNKSKTYDGTALASSFENAADYSILGLARGDAVTSITFSGSQTNAGTSTTTPKDAVIALGSGVTAPENYYSIIYVPGSLTVKPVSVFISVSADQWNTHSGSTGGPNYYTGKTFNVGFTNPNKQHFNDAAGSAYVSITSDQRTLFKGKYGNAIWNALYGTNGALISEKDAGTYRFTGSQQIALLSAITVDGQEMMSDPNYSIRLYARDSFLAIRPLPLAITTPSDSKSYDGTALTKTEGATLDHSYWTGNIGGTWTAAATAVPGEITLGTGDTIVFGVNGSQTEVGTSDNTYIIDWGATKSSNYVISSSLGTLEVTGGTLKITVKDKTSTYNGQEQNGYSIAGPITGTGNIITTDEYIIEGLAAGQVLTISNYIPAFGINVGTYNNGSFDNSIITIMSGEGADAQNVTNNYKAIEKEPGKLIIEPAEMTVEAVDYNGKYDGTSHGGGATPSVTEGTTVKYSIDDGQTWSDTIPTITHVGNLGYMVKATNPNYNDATDNGSLIVTARSVTMTSATDTKEYDGQALTNHNVAETGDGFIEGEGATYNVTGSQTAVGGEKGNNTFTYTLNEGTTASDYSITTANGTLTVTAATLTITAKNQNEYIYNGTTQGEGDTAYDDPEQIAKKFTIEGLKGNDAVQSITLDGQGTDAGEYSLTASNADLGSANGNYNIVYVDGTLKINPKELILASGNAEKEYDGTPLTNDDVEGKNANGLVVETGWVDGEGATYSFTGTITEEGEVPNAFTYTLKENTKESNYAIKKTEGTLKIDPRTMYTLTIHYRYDITGGGNTAAPDYVRAYVIGEEYNVKSPDITGFKPNMDRVTGTLDEDTEITVLYTRQAYNLTIRYRYIGGGEAAPTFRTTAEYGYTYSRTSPVIAGYTASDRVISGRMPARDVEFIVYYSPNDDRVIIDDYGTPLGLGNLGLNAGETIE